MEKQKEVKNRKSFDVYVELFKKGIVPAINKKRYLTKMSLIRFIYKKALDRLKL